MLLAISWKMTEHFLMLFPSNYREDFVGKI